MSARGALLLASALLAIVAPACHRDMRDHGRLKPLEGSPVFADGRASRSPVSGTVARGQLFEDEHLHRGRVDGELADSLPMPLSRALLLRGQERYEVFCAPCHARTGSGRGMIVERGMRQPPTFHQDRLREAPLGHFFDVMTQGYGAMYSYSGRIPPEDRWAIAAYLRVLQFSQHARPEQLPPEDRQRVEQR